MKLPNDVIKPVLHGRSTSMSKHSKVIKLLHDDKPKSDECVIDKGRTSTDQPGDNHSHSGSSISQQSTDSSTSLSPSSNTPPINFLSARCSPVSNCESVFSYGRSDTFSSSSPCDSFSPFSSQHQSSAPSSIMPKSSLQQDNCTSPLVGGSLEGVRSPHLTSQCPSDEGQSLAIGDVDLVMIVSRGLDQNGVQQHHTLQPSLNVTNMLSPVNLSEVSSASFQSYCTVTVSEFQNFSSDGAVNSPSSSISTCCSPYSSSHNALSFRSTSGSEIRDLSQPAAAVMSSDSDTSPSFVNALQHSQSSLPIPESSLVNNHFSAHSSELDFNSSNSSPSYCLPGTSALNAPNNNIGSSILQQGDVSCPVFVSSNDHLPMQKFDNEMLFANNEGLNVSSISCIPEGTTNLFGPQIPHNSNFSANLCVNCQTPLVQENNIMSNDQNRMSHDPSTLSHDQTTLSHDIPLMPLDAAQLQGSSFPYQTHTQTNTFNSGCVNPELHDIIQQFM